MNFEYAQIKGAKVLPGNISFYKEYGYLVAEQLLTNDEINELRTETAEIFRGSRGHVDGMIDPGDLTNDEILKKYVAIHFPHKISTVIKKYINHKKITDVLANIVSPNVKSMQSMLFIKAPGKAGQAWHQDEYYIPTRDKSLVGAWIAIDNATIDNGCLWIIPGSNKLGYIMKRVPNSNNEYADVDTVDVSGFAKENIIPVEVKSGSVIFFNGYTLHSSLKNKTANGFRTALVNHYMSAESMLPWDQDGKFEPTEDLRDIMMVAGEDPYAYKGISDLNKPYLRPETLKIKTDL